MKNFLLRIFLVGFIISTFNFSVCSASYSIGIVGCGNRAKVTDVRGMKIASFEIFNETMTDALTNGFQKLGKNIEVIDISEQAKQFLQDEATIQNQFGFLEKSDPSQVISYFPKKPDYLIYGYVTHLSAVNGNSLLSQTESVQSHISVRIIDVKNKKAVFVATAKGVGTSRTSAMSKIFHFGKETASEESVLQSIKIAAENIAKQICENV